MLKAEQMSMSCFLGVQNAEISAIAHDAEN